MQAPDRLRINNGVIYLDSCILTVESYLQHWMQQYNIPDGEPVCVIQRKELQRLIDEITFLRSLMQCA